MSTINHKVHKLLTFKKTKKRILKNKNNKVRNKKIAKSSKFLVTQIGMTTTNKITNVTGQIDICKGHFMILAAKLVSDLG